MDNRSTLVNILKTPSRTPRHGTAKKTRTVLAKEKDKENRLRLANAELESEIGGDSRGPTKGKNVSTLHSAAPFRFLTPCMNRILGPSFSPRHLRNMTRTLQSQSLQDMRSRSSSRIRQIPLSSLPPFRLQVHRHRYRHLASHRTKPLRSRMCRYSSSKLCRRVNSHLGRNSNRTRRIRKYQSRRPPRASRWRR